MSKNKKKKRVSYQNNTKPRYEIEAERKEKEVIEANKGHFIDDYDLEADYSSIDLQPTKKTTSLPEKEAKKPQKWYVLDTNAILSCVDILYDKSEEKWKEPNFRPKLRDAHLIIPETVFRELDRINKSEHASYERMMARIAIKRLAQFFPNSGRTIKEILHLEKPISTGLGEQTISLLPLSPKFVHNLPLKPAADDNDGWIAVTALYASIIYSKIVKTDVSTEYLEQNLGSEDVVLLTNDAHLQSKASLYGVKVSSYEYKSPDPFTGCRELEVPAKMFEKFYYDKELSREDFERFLPNELPLVANEYIIMEPVGQRYPRSYFATYTPYANIARYHKENDMLYPLRFMKYEGITPPNARIATYFDAMNDNKIHVVVVSGAPGTGKTFQAIKHAIKELREGKRRRIVLITTGNTKNDLGALPGGMSKKMEPLIAACKDAIASDLANTPEFRKMREQLRDYGIKGGDFAVEIREDGDVVFGVNSESGLNSGGKKKKKKKKQSGDYKNLDYEDNIYLASDFEEPHAKNKHYKDSGSTNATMAKMTYDQILRKKTNYTFYHFFSFCPHTQVAGRSFDDAAIIIDEIQRIHDSDDLLTMLTRTAKNSKLYICGDIGQIHNRTPEKLIKNGITFARVRYFDWVGCANIHLVDQMRNEVASFETEDYTTAYRRVGVF